MMREWFSIPELRAPAIPTFDEAYFNRLVLEYPELPSTVARARPYPGTAAVQLEFHVSLFLQSERHALQRYFLLRPIADRIVKLGIHLNVDTSRDGAMQVG